MKKFIFYSVIASILMFVIVSCNPGKSVRQTRSDRSGSDGNYGVSQTRSDDSGSGGNFNLPTPPPPNSISGSKSIYIPCQKESLDTEEFLVGLGISEKMDLDDSKTGSFASAKAELLNKYMGAFKNGLRQYFNDTHVPDGKKRDMSKIEMGAESAAESAINQYSFTYCREFMQLTTGTYMAFTVLRVRKEDVNSKVASRLKAMEVDYNEDRFFKWMNEELEKQSEQPIDKQNP